VAEQPGVIGVSGGLRLRAYGGERDVDAAWPWYRDLDTVRLVDGDDARPYTRTQVRSMYDVLSAQGEVYMIEESDPSGSWEVIGDVTLGSSRPRRHHRLWSCDCMPDRRTGHRLRRAPTAVFRRAGVVWCRGV
jgi:hypothetical protein